MTNGLEQKIREVAKGLQPSILSALNKVYDAQPKSVIATCYEAAVAGEVEEAKAGGTYGGKTFDCLPPLVKTSLLTVYTMDEIVGKTQQPPRRSFREMGAGR